MEVRGWLASPWALGALTSCSSSFRNGRAGSLAGRAVRLDPWRGKAPSGKLSQVVYVTNERKGFHGSHPWTLTEEESRPFIRRALEVGINFFDTSNS